MGYNALEIVTYSMICGAILLGFWAGDGLHQLAGASVSHIIALIYLGALPSATAYFTWGKAMSYAERTSRGNKLHVCDTAAFHHHGFYHPA